MRQITGRFLTGLPHPTAVPPEPRPNSIQTFFKKTLHPPMNTLLILTVGTGIAGPQSDVSAGLASTIEMVKPRLYWLVPSTSPKSMPVADLIRERVGNKFTFQPYADGQPYNAIPDPDDIHCCRKVFKEVIRKAKASLRPGEKLVVNPTGGTKQMSAAATIAALDEEVGEVNFTIGRREGGVVSTGTEVVAPFSTRQFFLDRDRQIAGELFNAGSFLAAERVLRSYGDQSMIECQKALCLHEWQRLNFAKAATHAAKFSQTIKDHLTHLQKADPCGPELLGELLAGADELVRWGDTEEAMARYYRGVEQAAKVRLFSQFGVRPPYTTNGFSGLPAKAQSIVCQLPTSGTQKEIFLGSQMSWEILKACADPMAEAYLRDTFLMGLVRQRNETIYGHGGEAIAASVLQSIEPILRRLFQAHMPEVIPYWTCEKRPHALV